MQQMPSWQSIPLLHLLRYLQPISGSQPSLIKHAEKSSLQASGPPDRHAPLLLQESPEVHALPSLQDVPDGLNAY
jgi:hypothetical protein